MKLCNQASFVTCYCWVNILCSIPLRRCEATAPPVAKPARHLVMRMQT